MTEYSKGLFAHKFGSTMFGTDEIDQIQFLTFSIIRETKFNLIDCISPKVISAKFFRILLISAKEDEAESKQDSTEGVLIKARFSKANKSSLYI